MNSTNNKFSKWFWMGSILFILIVGITIWTSRQKGQTTYKEFTVKRTDLETTILATGTVQPENRLSIKAPVAGRIDSVLIAEGAHVRRGQIIAWMSSTERAALLDAARARGQEEVQRWEELYKSTPIVAPLPGTIILRNIEPGQTITSTEEIFALSDRLTVKALVDETDIAKIKNKQKAQLILDAYPDQKIAAMVDQIAYEAKTVNNVTTYIVDVLPEQTPEFLRSGMTANVSFFQDKKENVLVVSSEAILLKEGKSTVLIKTTDQNPIEREVQVGLTDGRRTEIIEGLSEGDVVVRAEVSKSEKSASTNPFSPFSGNRRQGSTGGGSGTRR